MHTIADQDGSSVVPCLEHHILKVHLGDHFNRCRIEKVAHGSISGLEVPDRVHHLLVLLWDPVRRPELVVRDLGNAQLDNDVPADPVSWNGECTPLLRHAVPKQGS